MKNRPRVTEKHVNEALLEFLELYQTPQRMMNDGGVRAVRRIWVDIFNKRYADEWDVAVKRLIETKTNPYFPVPGEMTVALDWARDNRAAWHVPEPEPEPEHRETPEQVRAHIQQLRREVGI